MSDQKSLKSSEEYICITQRRTIIVTVTKAQISITALRKMLFSPKEQIMNLDMVDQSCPKQINTQNELINMLSYIQTTNLLMITWLEN